MQINVNNSENVKQELTILNDTVKCPYCNHEISSESQNSFFLLDKRNEFRSIYSCGNSLCKKTFLIEYITDKDGIFKFKNFVQQEFDFERVSKIDYPFPLNSIARLRHCIETAEDLFGASASIFNLAKIIFGDGDRYETLFDWDNKQMMVYIYNICLQDPYKTMYQLAHESVHCILQTGDKTIVTYLEEGMATTFARTYTSKVLNDPSWGEGGEYEKAHYQYVKLTKYDPFIMKKIRSGLKNFRDIEPINFYKVNKDIPSELIDQLLTKFYH